MTDGREEPSASYKLGNGWVILHWFANLTIILTGFTFIPARINAQPDGQVFIVWAIVQVAVLVVLGMASQFAVMRPLSMENWLRHCACASCFLPVSRGISLPMPLCQPWVDSGSLRPFPPPRSYLSHRLWDSCTLSITVGPLLRPISGSMPSPDLLSPPLWCSFPLRGSLSLVPLSAAWFPSCGTSRIDASRPL